MRFKSIDLETKKLLLLFLSLLFFWWVFSASATCSASEMPEPTYTITETELTTLENNISTLKSINTRLQVDLKVQSQEATLLRKQLDELKKELEQLRSLSQTQESSLTNANKLLAEYATEAKRERLRIKAQRNTWEVVACLAIIGCIVK